MSTPPRLRSARRLAAATTIACVASVATPVALTHVAHAAPKTYHVDDDAAPGGTGLDWTSPFDDLQDALAVAVAGDEIRVAGGTYSPGPNRTDTFLLVPDTAVLGGFAGNPASPDFRNFELYETVLTGELGVAGDNTDNTHQIVTTDSGPSVNGASFVLDGFTVTGAHAESGAPSSSAAGIKIQDGNVTLNNLKVTDNYSQFSGSGIFTGLSTDSVILTNSTITGNSGEFSANAVELVSQSGTVTVDNVTIANNTVRGLEIWRAEATITNLTVTNNGGVNPIGGDYQAGGVQVTESDFTVIVNSLIADNGENRGAGLLVVRSHVEGHNLVVAENTGRINSDEGSGLFVEGAVDQFTGDNYASFTGYNVSFINNLSGSSIGRHIYIDDALNDAGTEQLASATFYNSIVWNPGDATSHFSPTPPNITWVNSLVIGSGGSAAWNSDLGIDGGNNIDEYPSIVGWNSGDYRVRIESPAVAAGDESLLPPDVADIDNDGNTTEPLPFDVNGEARIQGTALDLGAYEAPVCSTAQTRLLVDDSAMGTGDGGIWASAMNDLQTALEGAPFCDTYPNIEIWVAAGTYSPTDGADRDASFNFPAGGLEVYGGFAGTETNRSQRNPAANETILSGEIGGAGVTDNSKTVVRFDGLGKTAGRLDGFTVRDGYDDSSGSGGAGVLVDGSWPVLANLIVENNHANDGGGIAFRTTTGAQLFNSILRNNTASTGAGLHADNASAPLVVNTLIHNNTANGKGGGIYNSGGVQLHNSTIADNTGISVGGYFSDGGGVIDNTIIWGNTPAANEGGAQVQHSNIESSGGSGSWSWPGSDGGGNIDSDPLFENAGLADYRLQSGSPSIGTGLNSAAIADLPDVDDDGNVSEPAPDLLGNDRVLDLTIEMGAYEYVLADADGDGIADADDNCPAEPNADQLDTDDDGDGNACDDDDDNDGIDDGPDNCPITSNADQTNSDDDAFGDACDDDDDNDGIDDGPDNCPTDFNPLQENLDGDILGDACDNDLDGDQIQNDTDNCPLIANLDQKDNDQDGDGDRCDDDDDNDGVDDVDDNCQFAANPDQIDANNNGIGDVCEGDADGDGVPDASDNCPSTSNADQKNTDGDFAGDACDSDDDNDTKPDGNDNCPLIANSDQADADGDGIGDVCDLLQDSDGDLVADDVDNCPNDANADQADADGDGVGDVCDPTPDPDPDPVDPEVFTSLDPARFADSRDQTTFDGQFVNTGPRGSGSTWEIDIAGRGDVPTDAAAVIVNLTVLNGTGPGFATAYPCGDLPNASSVNYSAGTVEPNEVIAKLSPTGTLCVYTLTQADVIVDVVGYIAANSPYEPITPTRYADSRDADTFDNTFRDTGIRTGGTTWEIDVAGRGTIPATATTVVANITVTGGTGPGFATVYPCTDDVPNASSLNYDAGVTIPNELVTKLSDTGALCVFTLTDAHVIVDIVGYLEPTPEFTSITPTRYADSRESSTFDNTFRDTGIRSSGTTWEIPVAGRGDIPSNATTTVANVTVTGTTGPGFATVYPCTDEPPNASSINYGLNTTRPNEVITKLSPTGTLCIYTLTATHLIIDITGHNGT